MAEDVGAADVLGAAAAAAVPPELATVADVEAALVFACPRCRRHRLKPPLPPFASAVTPGAPGALPCVRTAEELRALLREARPLLLLPDTLQALQALLAAVDAQARAALALATEVALRLAAPAAPAAGELEWALNCKLGIVRLLLARQGVPVVDAAAEAMLARALWRVKARLALAVGAPRLPPARCRHSRRARAAGYYPHGRGGAAGGTGGCAGSARGGLGRSLPGTARAALPARSCACRRGGERKLTTQREPSAATRARWHTAKRLAFCSIGTMYSMSHWLLLLYCCSVQ